MRVLKLSSILLLLGGYAMIARENKLVEGIQLPDLTLARPALAQENAGKARLFLAPDPSLPFLTVDFQFKGGLDVETIAQAGNLDALVGLLPVGGAGDYNGEQFSDEVAAIGARLNASSDQDFWQISLTFLKADAERALQLLEALLFHPGFEEGRLQAIKNKLFLSIRQRNDQPEQIARRRLQELMYPAKRAGYSLQASDVERISIGSLREDYWRRFSQEGLLVALSGDYENTKVKTEVQRLINKIPLQKAIITESLSHKELSGLKPGPILLVEVPDARQAVVQVGAHLPGQKTPDFFSLQHGNYILGGGSFNSRLMQEIRVKRGLAYYAYSYNAFRPESGRFIAGAGTRLDKATLTLELMLTEIKKMESSPAKEEMHLSREAIINSLIFQQDDPASYASQQARFYRQGLPDNFLDVFKENLKKMTGEQIRKSFRKHLQTGQLFLVVVGPASLKAELQKIRPVRVVLPEQVL